MDVKKLNLVNESSKVTPKYDLSGAQSLIRLFFNKNGRLLIIGQADHNYIYWASLTGKDEREKNEAIFNYIADEFFRFEMVSSERLVFHAASVPYDELKTWYQTDLVRPLVQNMAWKTPFGHYYGKDQVELNGRYFARDVSQYFDVLLKRCRFREANGAYEVVLDYCLGELSGDYGNALYYTQVEDLINMLRQEQYLVLSDQEQIREKYLLIAEKADKLYNQYQSAVR
ncbi:hypothetical protein [Lacrimispora sp.]|uniref:hypothetical protein n=1 Tax=Lacrimispora sp. TaxID=2719234 RepID=UPI0028A8B866|nr:hypothetical protein [Lacrimispora sp.]